MGITRDGLRFLAAASEVDFTETVTIGRQSLMVEAADLRAVGLGHLDRTGFAEGLFRNLGARTCDSIDASDFEGATIVHDMNTPISPNLHRRYTTVIDGGSLEHIFNLPVALANVMNLVRPGGHLLLITPANNEFGHGFYQFSPELFFRTLSGGYGFEPPRILVKDSRRTSPWLEVRDPAEVGGRGRISSPSVQYLYVRARRVGQEPIAFDVPPQQSDYRAAWSGQPGPHSLPQRNPVRSLVHQSRLIKLLQWYDPSVGITARRRPDPRYFRRAEP